MNCNWIYRLWASLKFAYGTFLLSITKGQITYREANEILCKYARQHNVHISDNRFALTNMSTMEKLISISPVKFRKYQKEIYDCDDFSFSFMGLFRFMIPNFAVGIAWTKTHALNFFIDKNKRVWFIEPQTNKLLNPEGFEGKCKLMII